MDKLCSADTLVRRLEIAPQAFLDTMTQQVERSRKILSNHGALLSVRQMDAIHFLVKERCGLLLSHKQLHDILALFPKVGITIQINSVNDEETQKLILDSVATLLVGTEFCEDKRMHEVMKYQAGKIWADDATEIENIISHGRTNQTDPNPQSIKKPLRDSCTGPFYDFKEEDK